MTILPSLWTLVKKHFLDFIILDEAIRITCWILVFRNKRNYSETTDFKTRILKQGEILTTSFKELQLMATILKRNTKHILCLLHLMDLTKAQNAVKVLSVQKILTRLIATRFSMFTRTCWMLERANTTAVELVSLCKIRSCNLMSRHFRWIHNAN